MAMLSAYVWQEGDAEFLWELELPHKEPSDTRLVYGEPPRGTTQVYPANNVPPKPLPRAGILYVEVRYIGNTALPPSTWTNSCTVKLHLTEDGGVKHLGNALRGEGMIIKPASAPSP